MDKQAILRHLNILVVDDDAAIRALICRMCRKMSIRAVFEAEAGKEALHWLRTAADPVDLIICDWNMPQMSGMELMNRMRSMGLAVPFIMLTGRSDLDSVIAAKNAGVAAYLTKPFSPENLQAKILFGVGRTLDAQADDPAAVSQSAPAI
jgi:two-component system, chemotaxis family, chemotaxis protein CheY